MYSQTIQPRFNETDALGHINNTVVATWFEGCRDPLFRLFTPDLNPALWQLILAKFSVEFHAELFYGEQVEIRRRGRPVAVLSRPRRKPAGSGRPDFLERLKSIYGDRVLEVTATDVLSEEREGR